MRKKVLSGTVVITSCLLAALALGCGTSNSYWARFLLWRDSDFDDFQRFPMRSIQASAEPFRFQDKTAENRFLPAFETVSMPDGRTVVLEELLRETGSTAFLVARDDELLIERYYEGFERASIHPSFSVAKSFVSALVGAAIEDGSFSGVEDPITRYLPELAIRDPRFHAITIRHLLTMSSGLRWRPKQGKIPVRADGPRLYYAVDLEKQARAAAITGPPGTEFLYNSYNPVLLGLALEKATGKTVSRYLEEKIWQPIGAEANASWSLDSGKGGLEKMESGLNALPIDYLKFARLYLRRGDWDGKQVLPEAWIEDSLRLDEASDPAWYYQYFWWLSSTDRKLYHPVAEGHLGQFLFISRETGLIFARFGTRYGMDSYAWRDLFEGLVRNIEELDRYGARPTVEDQPPVSPLSKSS